MGWKNVKEHYRIDHFVQVTDEGICIGSGYAHNLIVINRSGDMVKRYDRGNNEDLARYQREMDADPLTLRRLVAEPDTFVKAVTVYTYDGALIIEKRCEEPGWPNVTFDGQMMYENTYSLDRAQVVQWAKKNAQAGISLMERIIARRRQDLLEDERVLAHHRRDAARLDADYPEG